MRCALYTILTLLTAGPMVHAATPTCGPKTMSALLAPATRGEAQIRIRCAPTLKSTDVITKRVLIEGAAASGLTFDCRGARLISENGQALFIRSVKGMDARGKATWSRPSDVTIRNCRITGSVRIYGMDRNGEGENLRASSREDERHTERARAAAPTRVLIEKTTITGNAGIPLYVSPGTTYFTLRHSVLNGRSSSVAIYLDTESAHNRIENNQLHVKTSREVIAVDASSHNLIRGNYLSGLSEGGIFLYRNCGEGGTIRHATASFNRIENNFFYYNRYQGRDPSIWIASRNGGRSYCEMDAGFPWGSSVDNRDFARDNVVTGNVIYKLPVEHMIRVDEEGNTVRGNSTRAAK